MNFMGFIRPDGSVGTRNHLLVISTDLATDMICFRVASAVLQAVPVISGFFTSQHEEHYTTLVKNPNVAGAIVLETFAQGVGEKIAGEMSLIGKPVEIVELRAAGGPVQAAARATSAAVFLAREISTYKRQLSIFTRLVLGIIYKDESKTEDVLLPCLLDLVENNYGRIIIANETSSKKDKIKNLPAIKTLGLGDSVGQNRGVYELGFSANTGEILQHMVLRGVQLVLAATGIPCPASNSLVPIINLTADQNHLDSYKEFIELDLSGLDYEQYPVDEYSLLIINEIIATASGKLTKAEAFKI